MKNNLIHWYPGHMAVATKDIEKYIKIVDVIVELVDARAPMSSRHPFLANYAGPKRHLIVMSKADLADSYATTRWIAYFAERNLPLVGLDLTDVHAGDVVLRMALQSAVELHKKQVSKGMKPQPVRAMIVGIPNVGKSTLINRVSHHQSTVVADRPGVTRAPQWIKTNDKIWLLDTAGVLPMNYELPHTAMHLALIGSIRRDILPRLDMARHLFKYMQSSYPHLLEAYTGSATPTELTDFLALVARRFGLLDQKDTTSEKAADRFTDDFRTGKLGRITLEVVY